MNKNNNIDTVIKSNTEEQHQHDLGEDVDVLDDEGCKLVLYNDDYHTFDYVIKALMDICRHTYEQAEQCSIVVHYKGKCIVKTGGYDDILPMHTAMLDKQLTTEIIQ